MIYDVIDKTNGIIKNMPEYMLWVLSVIINLMSVIEFQK